MLVENSINQFWEGIDIKRENLCLTIDEYISIFMFIIVKSKIKDLESHLTMISIFMDDLTLFNSKSG